MWCVWNVGTWVSVYEEGLSMALLAMNFLFLLFWECLYLSAFLKDSFGVYKILG